MHLKVFLFQIINREYNPDPSAYDAYYTKGTQVLVYWQPDTLTSFHLVLQSQHEM